MTELTATERAPATSLPLLIVGIAAVSALGAPLWTLLLGPLLLGVPHVLGDLRVLWLQRPAGLTGRTALAIGLPIGALTLVRICASLGAGSWPQLEVAFGVLAVAIGGLAGAGSRAGRAAVAAAAAGIALAVTAADAPAIVVVLVAHAHDLVAVIRGCAWRGIPTDRRGLRSGAGSHAALASSRRLHRRPRRGHQPVAAARSIASQKAIRSPSCVDAISWMRCVSMTP